MEFNRNAPSVIARLMGLDEPTLSQPAYKQRRILSENYLQKSAFIGLREKSSFSVSRSSSMNSKKRKAIKDSFAFTLPKFKETAYSVTEENTVSKLSRVEMQIDMDVKQNSVKKKCYTSGESENLLEDGWKSDHSRNLARSNTLQICSNVSRNTKSRTRMWQKDDVGNGNKCTKQSQKHYVGIQEGRVVIPVKKSASRFYKCNPGLSNLSRKSLALTRNAAGLMANANAGIAFTNFDNLHSEPSQFSLSTGDDLSSYSWEASVRQKSLNESPQNRLFSLKDTIIDPNSSMNLKEVNQSSPNSVLEPHFKEGKLPSSGCFNSPVVDLYSVVRQLKFFETNSEETYSEGSEMAVSSVGNTEKGSFYFCQEPLGAFSIEESRDFSYLVDVLDSAHINFEVDFETCNSLDSPINPSLFEALEKKYGKQISWLKSERKLLFDRINSLLSEILNSFMDIHIRTKSLKACFHPTLRRSEIEEELWILLVNEEKEVGKDLSEKALGMETKWLKMEREISIICKDVEDYLYGELAAELYCI